RAGCCLRRDMSGSAPGLFLCRGCRLHFMLRPTYLLPAARLSPPDGLSTPRSGMEGSRPHLGPAPPPTDAYRGGTPTRWRTAARAVNQRHFEAPELIEALRRAGRALREAQESSAVPEEYSARQRAHQEALRAATDRAASLASERGPAPTADLKRRLDMNLKLLSAAEEVQPAPGRMVVELEPLGFDALSLTAPLAP